jgi:hypothetical protein
MEQNKNLKDTLNKAIDAAEKPIAEELFESFASTRPKPQSLYEACTDINYRIQQDSSNTRKLQFAIGERAPQTQKGGSADGVDGLINKGYKMVDRTIAQKEYGFPVWTDPNTNVYCRPLSWLEDEERQILEETQIVGNTKNEGDALYESTVKDDEKITIH